METANMGAVQLSPEHSWRLPVWGVELTRSVLGVQGTEHSKAQEMITPVEGGDRCGALVKGRC